MSSGSVETISISRSSKAGSADASAPRLTSTRGAGGPRSRVTSQMGVRAATAAEPPGIKHAGAYLTGLSFALDVPRTPRPDKVFEQMMQLTMRFADALHGEIVDDNRALLTANGRKVIAETIGQIAATMAARNVVPGGSAALRLYS